jgi:hypothetical protein
VRDLVIGQRPRAAREHAERVAEREAAGDRKLKEGRIRRI